MSNGKVEIRNGAWLSAQTIRPISWVVPQIIPEGQVLLVAPPKAGKSWLALAIAIARASGGHVLGQHVRSSPVLYLALEDGWRRLQQRSKTLLAADEAIPERLDFIIRIEPGELLETARNWLREHQGQRALVIIDTFGRVKPQGRNGVGAYEHDYQVMAALKQLVDDDPGSAMILVHHDRKAGSDDFVDSVSGTNGIAGAADTVVVIGRARTQGEAVLSVTGRDVIEAEYAVTFDGGRWSLAGTDLSAAQTKVKSDRASKNLGDRSADIVRFVFDHPDGVTPKQINNALDVGSGLNTYLSRLKEAGHVASPKRGLYTPVTTVTSVTFTGKDRGKVTQVTDVTPVQATSADDELTAPCGHPPYRTSKCPICLADSLGGAS